MRTNKSYGIERHIMQIRMDKELHTELKRVAETEHRSLSSLMHVMLSEQLKRYEKSKA